MYVNKDLVGVWPPYIRHNLCTLMYAKQCCNLGNIRACIFSSLRNSSNNNIIGLSMRTYYFLQQNAITITWQLPPLTLVACCFMQKPLQSGCACGEADTDVFLLAASTFSLRGSWAILPSLVDVAVKSHLQENTELESPT